MPPPGIAGAQPGLQLHVSTWPIASFVAMKHAVTIWGEAHSDVIGSRSPPRGPSPDLIRGLSRASTPFLRRFSKQHVGGRDKPGHDSGEMLRHDSNLGSAIIDVAPPPAHDLWRGAKPM